MRIRSARVDRVITPASTGRLLARELHLGDAAAMERSDLGEHVGCELRLVAEARQACEPSSDAPRRFARARPRAPCPWPSRPLPSSRVRRRPNLRASSRRAAAPRRARRGCRRRFPRARSSIVTSPLVPPYSSTTTAIGVFFFCMSRSTSTRLRLSGTKSTSRARPRRSAHAPLRRRGNPSRRGSRRRRRANAPSSRGGASSRAGGRARPRLRSSCFDRDVDDVDARDHRVARRALRETKHALDELALLAPARRHAPCSPRGCRRFLLRETCLRSCTSGLRPIDAEHDARRVLEDPRARA